MGRMKELAMDALFLETACGGDSCLACAYGSKGNGNARGKCAQCNGDCDELDCNGCQFVPK